MTGTGLLIDGDRVSLLHMGGEPCTSPGRLSDLAYVLGEGFDIDFKSVAGADEALEILSRNHLREESLDLALILLDSDLSEGTRMEAAAVLDHMLHDWDLRTWLEGVLYGAPLPAGADVDGALRHARSVSGTAVLAILSRLSDLQHVIGRVQEAWNSVCARELPLPASRNEATVLAARNGVFRHLVHASEGTNYDQFRFGALNALKPVAGHRQIVEELIRELHLLSKSRRPAELAPAAEDDEQLARTIRDGDRKDGEHLSFDRTATFENVKRQKDAIVSHMRDGRFDLVKRYVNELVEYQLPLDRRAEKTSKSLCDLAMDAKSLQLFELQLELANRAVGVRYQDGWAWAQVADASLILNRFEDALTAYRLASDFGEDLVGRTGYAQVLLTMGRLQESLATFEQVIRDYPISAFANTGRAEVLKSMGRLNEALEAYNAIGREFPNYVVAMNGRAEVLKSMGRLDEALEAYDTTKRDFTNDVVAMTGRAEVLKSMGRLDEALEAYDAIRREFPSDVIAMNGRAEVLKSMGRLDEALAVYDATGLEFSKNVVAKTGRAEVLKSMGRLDEAFAAYEAISRDFPNEVFAKNGRAEVLKSIGRLDDALAAYEAICREFPKNVVAKNGRAEVLKSMGRLDEAFAAYETISRDFPNEVFAKTGRAEVLKSMGRLDEALIAYDAALGQLWFDPVAVNGRASVLCTLGRYDDTLAALSSEPPTTRQDWIAFHIRGMAMLRAGRIDEASKIFLRGSEENPFAGDRDYFRNGLALARLYERAFEAALNILTNVRDIGNDRVAGFLRGHSAGALGDKRAAARFLSATGAPRNKRESELKAELERRFVRSEPALHDEEWLIQREVDCILLAA